MVATLLSTVPIYYRASFPDVLPISILRDTSNPRPCDPHPTFYNPCDLKEGSGDHIRAATLRMVAGIQAGILQVLQPASQGSKYADSKQDNYIVNSIMGLSEFSGNDATKYGLRTEKLVKSLYAQHLKIILTTKSQIVGY
ncbi:hypothetical protein Pmani_017023 [Petrolisthes manimaculis]|uniref:Uncharacterized protein n=1 Tax=Petrolisthes manimaculis TaxID=1843537 RepID=A0AAE1PQI3_9EUCA|nr:hypothetical protein Pmani_017023 [Petrolisthes manimaculis]